MTTTAGYAPSIPLKEDITLPPLRLTPVARSQTCSDSLAPPLSYAAPLSSTQGRLTSEIKYPRIIVRDHFGRTLDTFTTLQDAIYRAKWNRKVLGEFPKTAFEWRLPKAPVPSRPDFSRAEPKLIMSQDSDTANCEESLGMNSRSHDFAAPNRRIDVAANVWVSVPPMEIAVEDVSFVAESLRHLPNLPSFSFLRHSILAGQSTYIQIVASILLHQRHLQAVEHREAQWNFPGFCSGCRRAGFCYGCSKNPRPHVHEDIPAKTGGGFRFWKRDRPRDQHHWKHPGNWPLPSTADELRDIIEKYGGLAAYQQAVLMAKQEMARQAHDTEEDGAQLDNANQIFKLERLKNLAPYAPYFTIVSSDDVDERKVDVKEASDEDESEKDDHLPEITTSVKRRNERRSSEGGAGWEGSGRPRSMESTDSEYSADRTLVTVDTGYFEDTTEEDMRTAAQKLKNAELDEAEQKNRTEHNRERRGSMTHAGNENRKKHDTRDGAVLPTAPGTTSRLDFVDKEKELQDEETTRLRREPPKFFTVQKQPRTATVPKDPFSTDRVLDVPKGPTFQLKKTKKKVTQFVDFKRGERGWAAPKKFEIQHEDKTTGKLKGKGAGRDGKRKGGQGSDEDGGDNEEAKKRRQRDLSSDSGLDISAKDTGDVDSHAQVTSKPGEKDDDQILDDKQKLGEVINLGVGGDVQDDVSGQAGHGTSDEGKTLSKPKRREIEKESQVETPAPPQSPPRLPSPPLTKHTPTPPPITSPAPSPTPAAEEPPLPDVGVPAVPDLPQIGEKPQEKKKDKLVKFLVEPPPAPHPVQTKEEPKKRRAPPKIRIIPKNLYKPRRTRPAQAPVTAEELMDIEDPLDFLAKWCIINPDRLPYYEIIFEYSIADQAPRYMKPTLQDHRGEAEKEEMLQQMEAEERKKKDKLKKKSGKGADHKERELRPDLFPAERGMNFVKATMTIEEQHLEKLIYTLDLLQDKMLTLGDNLEELEDKRIKLLASKARETFPQVASPNYNKKKKKKGKKGKKKQLSEPMQKLRAHEVTDGIIVGRLDGKMLKELCQDKDMKFLDGEIEILKEKIREVQRRVEEIAREKLLTDAFCMNHYFMRQGAFTGDGEDFKRQQSELYNRLHPANDFELNLEELEEALQQINNHLLTKKEFYFLYNILNLSGRKKINFRLFTVIAALSEKVTQLDPVIRKLLNNFNYNALDIKMEKCKELFDLLESQDMPQGAAQAQSLAVELTAGGLRPEHTRHVLSKFNRDSKGVIDFLDFVTYIPLFVEIHKRIVQDPLKEDLDL